MTTTAGALALASVTRMPSLSTLPKSRLCIAMVTEKLFCIQPALLFDLPDILPVDGNKHILLIQCASLDTALYLPEWFSILRGKSKANDRLSSVRASLALPIASTLPAFNTRA